MAAAAAVAVVVGLVLIGLHVPITGFDNPPTPPPPPLLTRWITAADFLSPNK